MVFLRPAFAHEGVILLTRTRARARKRERDRDRERERDTERERRRHRDRDRDRQKQRDRKRETETEGETETETHREKKSKSHKTAANKCNLQLHTPTRPCFKLSRSESSPESDLPALQPPDLCIPARRRSIRVGAGE